MHGTLPLLSNAFITSENCLKKSTLYSGLCVFGDNSRKGVRMGVYCGCGELQIKKNVSLKDGRRVSDNSGRRVKLLDALFRHLDFRPTNVLLLEKELSVQIAHINRVEINLRRKRSLRHRLRVADPWTGNINHCDVAEPRKNQILE